MAVDAMPVLSSRAATAVHMCWHRAVRRPWYAPPIRDRRGRRVVVAGGARIKTPVCSAGEAAASVRGGNGSGAGAVGGYGCGAGDTSTGGPPA